MKSRTAFEILACTFAIGCGGGLFTGGSDDAGADVSSGGTGSGATGSTGSGSGTSGSTSGTSGSGSSGSGSSGVTGTGSSGTATTSAATTSASTTGAGGAVGSGGTGGSGFAGNGGTGGKTGAGGKAGAAGATGAGGTSGVGGSGGGAGGGKAGAGGSSGKAGAGGAVDGGVDWGACTGAGQCTAEITGCCSPCVTPELDRFAGVNSKYIDAFRTATCPVPTPCPRCATFPNPYIGARCAGTRCQAFDVRTMPEISKCGSNDECRLRKGLDCCECGSLDDWTAVSVTGQSALMSLVCAPTSGCPACVPLPPANLQAVCNAGHCEVGGGGLGGP